MYLLTHHLTFLPLTREKLCGDMDIMPIVIGSFPTSPSFIPPKMYCMPNLTYSSFLDLLLIPI